MDKNVCEKFENVWDKFPDVLNNGEYEFKDNNFLDSYCFKYKCEGDLDKINAGFFYLLNQFIGSSGSSHYVQNDINVVDYIILWLSYMLNLKPEGNISNLQYFYSTTINNDRYKSSIPDATEYKNYKDLIDKKKYFLGMDRNIISDFYEAFKLICE
ncbi:hypothetical protein YYC_00060, partial [Plasmodium yoelii 17X]